MDTNKTPKVELKYYANDNKWVLIVHGGITETYYYKDGDTAFADMKLFSGLGKCKDREI